MHRAVIQIVCLIAAELLTIRYMKKYEEGHLESNGHSNHSTIYQTIKIGNHINIKEIIQELGVAQAAVTERWS